MQHIPAFLAAAIFAINIWKVTKELLKENLKCCLKKSILNGDLSFYWITRMKKVSKNLKRELPRASFRAMQELEVASLSMLQGHRKNGPLTITKTGPMDASL